MIGRCLENSLVSRSPAGRLPITARRPVGHYQEFLLCRPNVHRPVTAGTLDRRLWVTAGSSADSRSPSGDCYVITGPSTDARAIIHRSSMVSPWAVPYMCTVLYCYIGYIITNNNNNILVMLLIIYYFLSCIVLACVYQKYD